MFEAFSLMSRPDAANQEVKCAMSIVTSMTPEEEGMVEQLPRSVRKRRKSMVEAGSASAFCDAVAQE